MCRLGATCPSAATSAAPAAPRGSPNAGTSPIRNDRPLKCDNPAKKIQLYVYPYSHTSLSWWAHYLVTIYVSGVSKLARNFRFFLAILNPNLTPTLTIVRVTYN